MSANMKLYFFNVSGIAEPIRYLLAYSGLKFKDFRFPDNEWEKHKPTMPVRQVPVLQIGNVKLHQHLSICRYLLENHAPQLQGTMAMDRYRIDAIVEDLNDMRIEVGKWWEEFDNCKNTGIPTAALEKDQRALLDKYKIYYDKWESALKGNKWLVTEKMSFADLYFSSISEMIDNCLDETEAGKKFIDSYKKLMKLKTNVREHDSIAAYIQARPSNAKLQVQRYNVV